MAEKASNTVHILFIPAAVAESGLFVKGYLWQLFHGVNTRYSLYSRYLQLHSNAKNVLEATLKLNRFEFTIVVGDLPLIPGQNMKISCYAIQSETHFVVRLNLYSNMVLFQNCVALPQIGDFTTFEIVIVKIMMYFSVLVAWCGFVHIIVTSRVCGRGNVFVMSV